MKKRIQGFIVGVSCSMILMTSVYATSNTKTIEIVENQIGIIINGVKKNIPNFLHEGTTYIPIRAISNSLDKTVTWDQETKVAIIEDAKLIEWTDKDMNFDRVHFGDDLEKIKYRIGAEPDDIIYREDGSIEYKCIIGSMKSYSLPDKNGNVEYLGIVIPEQTVLFYTNGPEQVERENMAGVYRIDVLSGYSDMIGKEYYSDGTYNGLLKTYGIPTSSEILVDGESEILWYQLPANKTKYLYFVIKDGNIISHGMEIKY